FQDRSSNAEMNSAVQIVEKVGETYVLKEDALRRILQQKSVLNKKVAVLTVAGAFRKGKSFFLSNCVRYFQYGKDWMAPTASVIGFTWRRSTNSVTEGILMWPEPFLVKNANGEELAILLMDTEGAFDHKSSISQCATVFALSALMSSVLVYNVMQDIQEDTLNHLQFFAKYGSYALDEQHTKSPFQSLLFLIRDWQNDDEYGMEAGRKLLDEKFKAHASTKDSMLALREDIKRSFVDIKCSLLPSPGDKIRKGSEGTITVNDMDPDFREEMAELIPYLTDNLIRPKEIGSKQITGSEFLEFFKTYINLFGSGKVPEPKSIYEATVEATHQSALTISLDHYNATMRKKFSELADRQYFEEARLQSIHQEITSAAVKVFADTKKMGELPRYLTTLKEKIEVIFKDNFLKDNLNRITIERTRKEKEEAERKRIEQEQRAKRELAEKERQREEMRLKMERERREKEEAERRRVEQERRHREEREAAERKRVEEQRRAREEQERRDREMRQQMERERRAREEETERVRKQMEQMRLESERKEQERERREREREEEHKRQLEKERQRREEAERERERERERAFHSCHIFFQNIFRAREAAAQRSYMQQSFMPSPSYMQSPSYDCFSPSYSNASRSGTPSGRSPGRPRGS
ncbi:hypothetical protein PENTCL1PPCAC_10446, partial [Pristionchus entomophagus]